MDPAVVRRVFPGLPVVGLRAQEARTERFSSEEKRRAFVAAFRDAVQDLMECGVQRIHLLLAAPTSLTIRMGMVYERRLMPDLWVYQYERSDDPPYPWAIAMPTHVRPQAEIMFTDRSKRRKPTLPTPIQCPYDGCGAFT